MKNLRHKKNGILRLVRDEYYANPCKCYDESFSLTLLTLKLNNASAALTIKYYIYISHGIKDKEMTQYNIKCKT